MGNLLRKSLADAPLLEPEQEFLPDGTTIDPILILAIINDKVSFLKSLQGIGVSMNMRDGENNTLLQLSIINESLDVFNFLLSVKNIQVDAVNRDGVCALTTSVQHGKESYALELLKRGAGVNITDKLGCNPLHYAVQHSSDRFCQILIKKGVNLNTQNLLGETPLHLACQYGNTEKICMLLYYGADALIPCDKGNIPLLLRRINNVEMFVYIYYYTFDEEVSLELKIVVRAMVLNWTLFPQMVEKVNQIIYDQSDLELLNESLPDISPKHFKIFFDKFGALKLLYINQLSKFYRKSEKSTTGILGFFVYFGRQSLR